MVFEQIPPANIASLPGRTYIQDNITYDALFFNGRVTGITQEYVMGVSYAYYDNYASGFPQWKENYVDGKGDWITVSPAMDSFQRIMRDDNKGRDLVVVINLRNPKNLSEIYAERYFRIQYPDVVTPLTETLIFGEVPPPPNGDKKANIPMVILSAAVLVGVFTYISTVKR